MEKIDNQYISMAIDELIDSLGIKDYVPSEKLFSLVRDGKEKECIKTIAEYLGLPIKINISYVFENSGQFGKTFENNGQFETMQLSKTDRLGRGTDFIAAQVQIPSSLPIYGTESFKNFPINISISRDCEKQPSAFVVLIAHELSHIVLGSIRHKERDNEFYVDLTAMILGFSKIILHGRRHYQSEYSGNQITERTTTYGYLSDDQFTFAYNKISGFLEDCLKPKEDFLNEFKKYKNECLSFAKKVSDFKKFINYLDQKNNQITFNKIDLDSIILFHQTTYFDGYEIEIAQNEKKIQELNTLSNTLHYTKTKITLLEQKIKETKNLRKDLTEKRKLMDVDMRIVKKYVGIFYRLKTYFLALF